MPANSKAGYALFHLDPVGNAELLKIHRDLWAHNQRYDYFSHQFPPDPEQEQTEDWFDYPTRLASGDYSAMMLKYSWLARYIVGERMEGTVVDLGCGTLAAVGRMLYSNRRKVAHYVGVDYRPPKPQYKPHFPHTFMQGDVTDWDGTYTKVLEHLDARRPDVIVSFEVLEHMSKEKGLMFLQNIKDLAAPYTQIFLSTPCHDNVHLPHDHVYEWTHAELKEELEKHFIIENNMGTFASQREIVPVLTPDELLVFQKMQRFYDSSMISVMFAPMHPAESRNSIWQLRALA